MKARNFRKLQAFAWVLFVGLFSPTSAQAYNSQNIGSLFRTKSDACQNKKSHFAGYLFSLYENTEIRRQLGYDQRHKLVVIGPGHPHFSLFNAYRNSFRTSRGGNLSMAADLLRETNKRFGGVSDDYEAVSIYTHKRGPTMTHDVESYRLPGPQTGWQRAPSYEDAYLYAIFGCIRQF